MGFWKSLFMVLQLISALALTLLVMLQATKGEGLTGTIGGKAESAFQGKPGLEEQLGEWTKYAAITFMVISAVVAYLFTS